WDSGESLQEGDVVVDLRDFLPEVLPGVRRNHPTEDDDIEVLGVVLRQHLVELVCCVCVEALAAQDVRSLEDHARASADDQDPLRPSDGWFGHGSTSWKCWCDQHR